MRIYADINRVTTDPRDFVIQVAPAQESVTMNGKFLLDVPDGVAVPDPLPADVGDLLDTLYGGLLARYPLYQFITHNVLVTGEHSGELDLSATFPHTPGPGGITWNSRAQIGRFGAGSHNGLAPTAVKILGANEGVAPPRPGLLVTDTIDVSGDVPGGITNYMVYWKVLDLHTTDDVMDYVGGTNTPARKILEEDSSTQNPAGLEVYISGNDGAGYTRCSRLIPGSFGSPGTLLRLAFVNHGTSPITLAAYAVMY